jgi:cell division protein FtsL
MTRLNLVLLAAVVVSALFLVQTQYESRRVFVELERAHNLARKLDVEYDRLQVERRAQSTPLRVDKLARSKLDMRSASPAITHYVADSLVAPQAPASAGTLSVGPGSATEGRR